MKLTEKQWNLINEITLKIHLTDDLDEMRKHFLYVIGALLQFDEASFYLQEEDYPYGSPMGVNLTKEDFDSYLSKYKDKDPFAPIMGILVDSHDAIRASDYDTMIDIENSDYYKEVWKPKGIRYSMFIPLAVNRQWLGTIHLFRHIDKPDFSDEELQIANVLKSHMQARLWREKVTAQLLKDAVSEISSVEVSEEMVKRFRLTGKECQVISLWSEGLTDQEICDRLSITKNTLKKHISNIFGKMEIGSRVEMLKILPKK